MQESPPHKRLLLVGCSSRSMRLAEHTSRFASRLVLLAMSIWSVKTPRAPSRHCRDARVYGHTTTTMHDNEYTPPPLRGTCKPAAHLRQSRNTDAAADLLQSLDKYPLRYYRHILLYLVGVSPPYGILLYLVGESSGYSTADWFCVPEGAVAAGGAAAQPHQVSKHAIKKIENHLFGPVKMSVVLNILVLVWGGQSGSQTAVS